MENSYCIAYNKAPSGLSGCMQAYPNNGHNNCGSDSPRDDSCPIASAIRLACHCNNTQSYRMLPPLYLAY